MVLNEGDTVDEGHTRELDCREDIHISYTKSLERFEGDIRVGVV